MIEQPYLDGSTKTDHAIAFMREHEPEEGYMGCFSGGKDSTVLRHLANRAGIKVKWYYSVMHDPPELIQFLKKHYPWFYLIRLRMSD